MDRCKELLLQNGADLAARDALQSYDVPKLVRLRSKRIGARRCGPNVMCTPAERARPRRPRARAALSYNFASLAGALRWRSGPAQPPLTRALQC